MFPRQQDSWSSLEDYYLAHRRVLMGVLMIPPVASFVYNLIIRGTLPNTISLAFIGVRVVLPLMLIFSPNPWVNRSGLALLSATMLAAIFAFHR